MSACRAKSGRFTKCRSGARLAGAELGGVSEGRLRSQAEAFFRENASSSYDPKVETQAQGRARGAQSLAAAEAYASAQGWRVDWRHDDDCDPEDYDESEIVQSAVLRGASGEVLASLGCIRDADRNYRRVVGAELALEAKLRRGR